MRVDVSACFPTVLLHVGVVGISIVFVVVVDSHVCCLLLTVALVFIVLMAFFLFCEYFASRNRIVTKKLLFGLSRGLAFSRVGCGDAGLGG